MAPDHLPEIELLDPEAFEAPRRLSRDDCRDHAGGEARRRPHTETEQDDDQ